MQGRRYPSVAAGTESVAVPDSFFSQAMPQLSDVAELKVIVCILYLLNCRRDDPPFVTHGELLSGKASMLEIDGIALRRALDRAVRHGAILRSTLKVDGGWEELYFANTESGREALDKVGSGELSRWKERGARKSSPANVFALYEQNIGIITPMIAEELKEAEKLYALDWIEEAFKEAVIMNKRNWKYVSRILERWAREGKDSGENRPGAKARSPDKYIKGKYGHMVKR
ncbi:MAG: DnaD domain protein [Dehalococcoidia bacterium]|nr:DnaD domain protein [Dehalococcoidia bacterium]